MLYAVVLLATDALPTFATMPRNEVRRDIISKCRDEKELNENIFLIQNTL